MRVESISIQDCGVFKNVECSFPLKKEEGKAEIHLFTGKDGSGKSTILRFLSSFFLPTHRYLNWYVNHCYVSNEEKRLDYLEQLDCSSMPDYQFGFAVFCYTGYFYVLDGRVSSINNSVNPLLYAGFFDNKPIDSNYCVKNLLAMALIGRQSPIVAVSERYYYIVNRLESAIGSIIGKSVNFVLTDSFVMDVDVVIGGRMLCFEMLGEGHKSLINWLVDLVLRLDMLKWEDDTPVFERQIILLLDEIGVYLDLSSQRRVLPVVQGLFPNAQIFATTNSPFVVNSVNGAFLYRLDELGADGFLVPVCTSTERSYIEVVKCTLGVGQEFGEETQRDLDEFMNMIEAIRSNRWVDMYVFKSLSRKIMGNKNSPICDIVHLELVKLGECLC